MSTSPQNREAEKVEESLRDFIGRIITYYEKYKLPGELLDRFERKITEAETLLEVFEVMKEMFEELMSNISHHSSREMLDCSELGEDDEKENFEKVLQKYEAEIKTHVKVEQEMQGMIQELQGKVEDSDRVLKDSSDHIKKLERDHTNLMKRIDELEIENEHLKTVFESSRPYGPNSGKLREKVVKKKKKRTSIKQPIPPANTKHLSIYRMLKYDPRLQITSHSVTSTKNSLHQNSYFIKPAINSLRKKTKKKGSNSITNSQDGKYSILKGIFGNDTHNGISSANNAVNPRRHKNASIV